MVVAQFESFLDTAGVSEAGLIDISDMQGTTITDRYRHRLRGQLESDGAVLDSYLRGEGATVIALPLTGAPAPGSEPESVTFATTRAEGIR